MSLNSPTAYGVGSPQIDLAAPPIVAARAPGNGDHQPIGQTWVNTALNNQYVCVGYSGGNPIWVISAGSTGQVNTLTGDSGGAISPTAGNINILGGNTVTTAGSGSNITLTTKAGGYPTTPFVVGSSSTAGYTTVQAGINAAHAAGGGVVYIQPGTYTENLTLFSNVILSGGELATTIITGVHTPPASGTLYFINLTLTSATHIFSSAAAGTTSITLQTCVVNCTNGFLFNLVNWTGALNAFSVGDASTNNGFVNNTGGSAISTANTDLGRGSGQTMVVSGAFNSQASSIHCPVNFVTGAVVTMDGNTVDRMMTFSNNSTAIISNTRMSTGAVAAITQSSTGTIALENSTIDTSASPCVAGAGAGALTVGTCTFMQANAFAATITIDDSTSLMTASKLGTSNFSNWIELNSNILTTGGTGADIDFNITPKGAGKLAVTTGNIQATLGDITATAGKVIAGTVIRASGDAAGAGSTVSVSNVVDETLGAGAGTVLMKTGNPGNSSGWLKIYNGTNVRYVPYWTNISP